LLSLAALAYILINSATETIMVTTAITLIVLACIDLLMIIGYCMTQPRVLATCYVLKLLTVPTLITLAVLSFLKKSDFAAWASTGLTVVYIATHFVLHR